MKANKDESGHEQVIEFLNSLDHPQKNEIEEVRKIILNVNENITEHIKWNAPSFCYHNEDRVTFNLQGKGFFRLIFHTGAKVIERVEQSRLFEDTTGLLEWVTNDRAIVKLKDMSDVESKRADLVEIVGRWIEVTTV
ncbi:DUF1801 domain-containing protein [Paenibacillus monticola]|uniref:DUF1801 domain-containing protein n=1 Tax=Paenibacillus monticola TaxID=2666075 RepID=A0A7X2H445_9BACL|nr:DUF1801 domain-containing protein [Paenibacillus monticola]MRN53156.1 DUF1801 domain-containing protein [Paenibacillus monticola]